MGMITHSGIAEQPRRTFETPKFVHQEWPEHVSRCCTAIRARRMQEMQAHIV